MKTLLTLALVMGLACTNAQVHEEILKKEISFEKASESNTLIVANIFGNITVQGYSGTSVKIEVKKTIKGKTEERLKHGIETIKLGVVDRADTLILFTDGLCQGFKKWKNGEGRMNGWGYDWRHCDHEEGIDFDYKLDFTIHVPENINVVLSTVNDGGIDVKKVKGVIIANNVNGDIDLGDLVQAIDAHTINGDVNVNYVKQPLQRSRFYTLNGNINANFPKGLAADVNFKSFNGEFYTNVAKLDNLPVNIEKEPSDKGTKYAVNGNRFRAGNGGVLLDFETFNGNVYLKEAQ